MLDSGKYFGMFVVAVPQEIFSTSTEQFYAHSICDNDNTNDLFISEVITNKVMFSFLLSESGCSEFVVFLFLHIKKPKTFIKFFCLFV